MLGTKCIVKLCPNRQGQGTFRGTVCNPCYIALQGERPDSYAGWRIIRSVVEAHTHA